MTDWILFYEDGSSFSNDDGSPEDAPREGVIVVVIRDITCGRQHLWNQDTYCWQDGTWVPHDSVGCERYLNITKWPIRLRGYWITDDKWEKIRMAAINDTRIPAKTAISPRESDGYAGPNRYGNSAG